MASPAGSVAARSFLVMAPKTHFPSGSWRATQRKLETQQLGVFCGFGIMVIHARFQSSGMHGPSPLFQLFVEPRRYFRSMSFDQQSRCKGSGNRFVMRDVLEFAFQIIQAEWNSRCWSGNPIRNWGTSQKKVLPSGNIANWKNPPCYG